MLQEFENYFTYFFDQYKHPECFFDGLIITTENNLCLSAAGIKKGLTSTLETKARPNHLI